jgi:hypothetical protein
MVHHLQGRHGSQIGFPPSPHAVPTTVPWDTKRITTQTHTWSIFTTLNTVILHCSTIMVHISSPPTVVLLGGEPKTKSEIIKHNNSLIWAQGRLFRPKAYMAVQQGMLYAQVTNAPKVQTCRQYNNAPKLSLPPFPISQNRYIIYLNNIKRLNCVYPSTYKSEQSQISLRTPLNALKLKNIHELNTYLANLQVIVKK